MHRNNHNIRRLRTDTKSAYRIHSVVHMFNGKCTYICPSMDSLLQTRCLVLSSVGDAVRWRRIAEINKCIKSHIITFLSSNAVATFPCSSPCAHHLRWHFSLYLFTRRNSILGARCRSASHTPNALHQLYFWIIPLFVRLGAMHAEFPSICTSSRRNPQPICAQIRYRVRMGTFVYRNISMKQIIRSTRWANSFAKSLFNSEFRLEQGMAGTQWHTRLFDCFLFQFKNHSMDVRYAYLPRSVKTLA